jgi:hypothetical protein
VSEALLQVGASQDALLAEIETAKGLHYCGKSLQAATGDYFPLADLEVQPTQAEKELKAVAEERERISVMNGASDGV